MNIEELSKTFRFYGKAFLLLSVIWWVLIYAPLKGMEIFSDFIVCLYSTSSCAVLNMTLMEKGYIVYEPLVFWLGITLFILGVILNPVKNEVIEK